MVKKENTTKAIYIVDDDEDDLEVIQLAAKEARLDIHLKCFRSGMELKEAIKDNNAEPPFLIICDMNLPGINGLDIRRNLLEDPNTRYASIPFVYWTTGAPLIQVQKAYDLNIQGFFVKPSEYKEIKQMLIRLVNYWEYCIHPKNMP